MLRCAIIEFCGHITELCLYHHDLLAWLLAASYEEETCYKYELQSNYHEIVA